MDKPVVGKIVFEPLVSKAYSEKIVDMAIAHILKDKKKLHHKPLPLERNGFLAVLLHVEAVRRGAVLDLDLLERTARVGIRYIDAVAAGQMPQWHDLTGCPGCGLRDEKHQDVHGLCDLCNAKNKVAGDHE